MLIFGTGFRYKNFRNYEQDTKKVADITITTRETAIVDEQFILFFIPIFKREREIGCDGSYWFFLDNGEWTPDRDVDNLARAYKFKNRM